LRLYLDINQQRLRDKIIIDKSKIYKKIIEEEIIFYGVFVFDNKKRGSKFFLLEEIDEEFYINPRNTMFQVKYNPKLLESPLRYYSFLIKLIDSTIVSLEKSKSTIETEILTLRTIKAEIIKLKK
jgi:hypothetical protein